MKKKKINEDLKDVIKTYNENTRTLVLQGKKEVMDIDTGEITTIDAIQKQSPNIKSFWKCYLMDFLSVLGIMDNKQLDIFIYIAENTNPATNLFIGTYKKIHEDLGVSSATISRIMRKLQDHGFIKKVQNGVWFVNPNILMKGNDKKRQILLTYFVADNPVESITYSRTKGKAKGKEKDDKVLIGNKTYTVEQPKLDSLTEEDKEEGEK